jgi:hypothetical protein
VLDLLLTKLSAERPNSFFVQIGANNGLTDDPIRQFVTKYHWHGVLVEPQPQVFQQLFKVRQSEERRAVRGLDNPQAAGVEVQAQEVEVPDAVSTDPYCQTSDHEN